TRSDRDWSSDVCSSDLLALVDVVVGVYAPLPGASLSSFVRELRFAVPQWHGELSAALHRARQRLSQTRIDGIDWYWPAGEDAARSEERRVGKEWRSGGV